MPPSRSPSFRAAPLARVLVRLAGDGAVRALDEAEEPEEGEEDDEVVLPPLDDGGDDEAGAALDEADELSLEEDEPGGDPLDDAAAADLDTGADLDDGEDDEGLDEGDGEGLDVGPLDEGIDAEEERQLGDELGDGVTDEDELDLLDEEGIDDGSEGTNEAPENEVDEAALPELDADEEGEEGDEQLAEELLAEAGGALPSWEAAPWSALEGAGVALPCAAVAVAAGRVAAAGKLLLLVDEGARAARRATFGTAVTSVAVTDEGVIAATPRGQLLLTADAGATSVPLAGFRGSRGPVQLAATLGRVWILVGGALLSMSAARAAPLPVRSRGVRAVTAGGGVLTALTSSPDGPAIERLRSDDEGWSALALEGAALAVASSAVVRLAAEARGARLALADEAQVVVSRDGGVAFQGVPLARVVALAFAGEAPDAPLLCLVASEPGRPACLVQIPARGAPTRVAEIPFTPLPAAPTSAELPTSARPAEPEAMGLAWDATREVAWVACAAGLLAFGPSRKH